jgi:hypothetical protein
LQTDQRLGYTESHKSGLSNLSTVGGVAWINLGRLPYDFQSGKVLAGYEYP